MLPRPMQLHLLIVTNRRLFTDVALFKSCEPEVVAVCLRVMGQQICVPYERVLVKGEPPRALFIIRSGHVQVSKDVAVGEQGGGQSSGQGGGQGHASASASAGAPGNTRERTPRLSQCSVGGMQGVQGVQGIMKSGSSLSGGSSKSDMADKGNRSDTGDRSDTPSSADAKSRLAADFSLLYKQTHASNVIDFYANEIFGERSLITRQAVAATVTSITYTDLLVLPAGDFYRLLEQFPQLHETVLVCTGLQDGLAEGRRQKSSRGRPRRRASPPNASWHRQRSQSFMAMRSSSSKLKRRGSSDLSGVQSLSSEHDEPRAPPMHVRASRTMMRGARSFGGGMSPSRERRLSRSGVSQSRLRDGEEEAKGVVLVEEAERQCEGEQVPGDER